MGGRTHRAPSSRTPPPSSSTFTLRGPFSTACPDSSPPVSARPITRSSGSPGACHALDGARHRAVGREGPFLQRALGRGRGTRGPDSSSFWDYPQPCRQLPGTGRQHPCRAPGGSLLPAPCPYPLSLRTRFLTERKASRWVTPRPDRPLKSLLSAPFPELSAACSLSLHSDTQTRLCPYAHPPAQAPSGPWSPRVPSRPSPPPRLTVPCPQHLRPPDAPPWAFSTPPLVPAAPLKVTRVHPLLPGLTLTLHPGDPAAGLPWPPHFSHPQPLLLPCPPHPLQSTGREPGNAPAPHVLHPKSLAAPGPSAPVNPDTLPQPSRPPKPTQGPSSPLPAAYLFHYREDKHHPPTPP